MARLVSRRSRRLRLLDPPEGSFLPLQARAHLAMRSRCSHAASPCQRRCGPGKGIPQTHASWRLKPDSPTSAVRFSTHGHTRMSSRSSSARGCRLRPRSMTATRLASSHRLLPSVIKRPDEEPCLLRILLRPISRPSFSRGSTLRLGHVNVAAGNELRKFRSTPGTARRATWVAVPKRRFHRRFPPVKSPPSSAADTPCRLPKICPDGGSLRSLPGHPGGRRFLRKDLDLERSRLREENALADSQGAWNPS
jgi:hypothetical protein